MTRRSAAVFVILLLFAGACGSGDDTDRASSASSPSAAATATPGAADDASSGTPSPGNGDEPSTTAGPGSDGTGTTDDGRSGGTSAGTQQTGGVNRPAEGLYVYRLEGSRTNPFCPQGCEYRSGSEATTEIDANGDVYTARTTTSDGDQQEGGASVTRLRWQSDRIVLLQTRTETQVGTFGCTFDPPVKVQDLPIRAASWTVTWKGANGEDCEGSTTITVAGREDVADANGRTWSTWKVEQRTQYRFGDVSGTLSGPTWFSPEIGTAIKTEQTNEGTFRTRTGAEQPFSSHTVVTLKTRP